MTTSFADNQCKCTHSRKKLYHLLQAGRQSREGAPDMCIEFCNTFFRAGWRNSEDPVCIEGTALSDHPESQCVEHRRTMAIQMCAFVGLCLLCAAIGLCFTSSTSDSTSSDACQCANIANATDNTTIVAATRTLPSTTSLQETLSASSMSLLAVAVWRHVVELSRARSVKWPNSRLHVAFALAPLLVGLGFGFVALFVKNANVMLSLGCSIGSMYLTELMTTVTSWKRQRLDRSFDNPDVKKLLKASYRSATVLLIGLVLPVGLASGVCAQNAKNATKTAWLLFGFGGVLWMLPMIYVLCELKEWKAVHDSAVPPARYLVPVLGTVVFITPQKCSDSPLMAASSEPMLELPRTDREGIVKRKKHTDKKSSEEILQLCDGDDDEEI